MIFRKSYFILSVVLFFVEIAIAAFVHDGFVRPYLGDFFVVILIYCFVQAFFPFPVWKTALGVLLFAFLIEWTQYLRLINRLDLNNIKIARLILGSSFEWVDMLVYTLGIVSILLGEKYFAKCRSISTAR